MTQWSTPAGVRAKLRKRWETGEALTRHALGEEFVPVDLPIRGPSASELGARYAEVAAWVRGWAIPGEPFTLTTKLIGARRTGANEIPDRFCIATFDDLVRFLRVEDEVRRHAELVVMADSVSPQLRSWVIDKPMRALAHADPFGKLLACAQWLNGNADRNRYLRQIDVAGVDTKFIERHHAILSELLDQMAGCRADRAARNFAARYGFRDKPARMRIRFLDPQTSPFFPGISDVELRTDELGALALDVDRVFVVENEVTCLAFPAAPRAILIFGGGYAVSRAGKIGWLRDLPLFYWGDIDTHGFRILDLLRSHLPQARSMLMDRATLLKHEAHWDSESVQVNTHLGQLTADEASLYRDLVEDTFGAAVRLEQERVQYSLVVSTIEGLI